MGSEEEGIFQWLGRI